MPAVYKYIRALATLYWFEFNLLYNPFSHQPDRNAIC